MVFGSTAMAGDSVNMDGILDLMSSLLHVFRVDAVETVEEEEGEEQEEQEEEEEEAAKLSIGWYDDRLVFFLRAEFKTLPMSLPWTL